MTAVFKNRLIGSAILMIAAIVFLPDLLDGQKQVNKDDFKAIPDRPEFAQVAEQQVFQRAQHDASRADALALPVENEPVLDTGTDPAPTQDVLPDQQYASISTDSKAAAPVHNSAQMVSKAADTVAAQPQQAAGGAVANKPVDVATTTSAEPAATAAKQTATVEPQVLPATKPAAKALSQSAWVVKVGSFSKEQNANALVTKLREAGFATFSRKIINSQGQTMISVVVGPDLQKDKLEASLPKLQQLANISTLKVSAFSPAENN
jgi:DedD protein